MAEEGKDPPLCPALGAGARGRRGVRGHHGVPASPRRATDAAACHSRHGMPPPMPQYFLVQLTPVGFRGSRLARMAAGGAMMAVAREPIASFYSGLGTLYCGLATLYCGLATLFCGLMTRLWSADPAAVWWPSTVVW